MAVVRNTTFNAGELIKGSLSTVYYFASDGKRYVFPNEKTYFTWYPDFTNVHSLDDDTLGDLPLGGNVTYRPGVKLVKVMTSPRVYAIDRGGILRWVQNETIATTLYGPNWSSAVDDLPDWFFSNYTLGTPIADAAQYHPADVKSLTSTITQDKSLDPTIVTITIANMTQGFVPSTFTVKRGTSVTWVNRDSIYHTVTGPGWDSGPIQPNASFTYTFNTPGSVDYYCAIHPGMRGTVNVVR